MTSNLSAEQRERAQAILTACDAALIRLNQASFAYTGPPVFGPLGEALFWLCALDELLDEADQTYRARRNGHVDGWVIPGLKWARNQIAHGVTVVHLTGMIPGAELGMMRLGLSRLGSVATHYWSGRLALPPPRHSQHQSYEQSYDQRVGGRVMQEPLAAARAFLIAEAGLVDPFAEGNP